MKANETKVEDFLSSNKTQFVIPVYQRNYDWSIGQCRQLLDDILEVGANKKMNAHFIGSIVYVHDDVYTASRIKELTVIDGQQPVAINDTYFIEGNIDNIGKFDRIKQALTVLNLEDELTIKYASETIHN